MHYDTIGMLSSEEGRQIALKGVTVEATLAGLMAETRLEQRYRNDTGGNLEVAYTFPLPVDGVLLRFEVDLGGKTHTGQVMPRRAAETQYEASIEQGDAAFRLQKLREGLYNATLGNVKDGEEVLVRLTWAEPLAWNGNAMRYRLPTTLAPRYGVPKNMQPWQRPKADSSIEYPLVVKVKLLGDLARATFECPTHRVGFSVLDDGVQLTLAGDARMDRDFVLDVRPQSVSSMGISARVGETAIAALNFLPAPVDLARAGEGRDTVIVLDCSGSMAGDSLAKAKEGVQLALAKLRPEERFALIGFGSRHVSFDAALQPANRKNLDLARYFVGQLPDMGGTEMATALDAAMAYGTKAAVDILLLTDGEAWQVDKVVNKARKAGHRIFSIGIGAAVAEDTVRKLADETGGACELVTPNEAMVERITRHFDRMRQPRIEEISLDWGRVVAWSTEPTAAVFAGDSVTIFTAFADGLPERVKTTLRFSNGAMDEQTVMLRSSPEMADSLLRMATHARLPALDKAERLDLAVRHQLVTDDTDYLITVARAEGEKSDGLPALQVVPQMLAAGWGGTATVMPASLCDMQVFDVGGADYSAFDVPAVMRSTRASGRTPPAPEVFRCRTRPRPVLTNLLDGLNRSEGFALRRSLPKTLKALKKLGLPEEIVVIFEAALQDGLDEQLVVWTFLSALATHRLGARLDERFHKLLEKAVTGAGLPDKVLAAFAKALDELPEVTQALADVDRYDIPGFL